MTRGIPLLIGAFFYFNAGEQKLTRMEILPKDLEQHRSPRAEKAYSIRRPTNI